MPKTGNFGGAVLGVLSSGRLALVLILVLILLALVGTLLPQEGKEEPSEILGWQEEHTGVSVLARPLGLFRVFHSVPFLTAIIVLALNTLTCTLRRLLQPKGRKLKDIRAAGFLGLHISLLLLMGGGFHSGATRMDGYLVLTEGQTLPEEARSYVALAKGPLRREGHQGFQVGLEEVDASYDSGNRLMEPSAKLEFESREGRAHSGTVRINYPVSFLGVSFTLDETGFSPRLAVRKQAEKRLLVDSFIALKTFREGGARDYRDFLILPFLEDKIFLRFLPDSKAGEGRPVKSGDKPGNSLLQLWTESGEGEVLEENFIHPGQIARLAGYDFTLLEFRRWAGFRVVQDSGYAWVLAALWLGLGSLLLRYIPDIKGWFSPRAEENETAGGQQENGTA